MRHACRIALWMALAGSLGCGDGGGSSKDSRDATPTTTPTPVASATAKSTPVAAANAWSVGDRSDPDGPDQPGLGGGIILRSSDGGAHWVQTFLEPGSFAGIAFADATRGWAVGFRSGAGEILRSDDTGLSWASQRAGVPFDVFNLFGVQALSRDVAIAVGSGAPIPGTANAPSVILRTEDAGVSWAVVPIATGGGGDPTRTPLASVCIAPTGTGIVVGSGMNTAIATRTSDNGHTWMDVTTRVVGTSAGELFDVACRDDEFWVATNGTTFARYSADGGETWRDVTVPADVAALAGISAPARGVAVAVGIDSSNGALIIRTEDAGVTWTRQPIEGIVGEGTLHDVAFAGPDDGTAVGGRSTTPGSLTVLSPTQGATWTSGVPLDGFVRLLDVARIP